MELRTEKGTLKSPLPLLCPIEMNPDKNHSICSGNDNLINDTSELIQNKQQNDSNVGNRDESTNFAKLENTSRRTAAITGVLKRRLAEL